MKKIRTCRRGGKNRRGRKIKTSNLKEKKKEEGL
jgi:hypothetical protein